MNSLEILIILIIIILWYHSFEEWRVIQEFGTFEVSNWGRVRHRGTKKIKSSSTLKTRYSSYKHVSFRVNGLPYQRAIHRLVATEFWPNPEGKPVVDHKNRNTHDNRASNLRWCTYTENSFNRNKGMKVQSPSSKYKGVSWNTSCRKWLVHVRGQHVGVFESEKEAAYAYNIRAKQDFGAFVKLNEIQFDKNGCFNFDYYCKN